jgi:hypothetical protein
MFHILLIWCVATLRLFLQIGSESDGPDAWGLEGWPERGWPRRPPKTRIDRVICSTETPPACFAFLIVIPFSASGILVSEQDGGKERRFGKAPQLVHYFAACHALV